MNLVPPSGKIGPPSWTPKEFWSPFWFNENWSPLAMQKNSGLPLPVKNDNSLIPVNSSSPKTWPSLCPLTNFWPWHNFHFGIGASSKSHKLWLVSTLSPYTAAPWPRILLWFHDFLLRVQVDMGHCSKFDIDTRHSDPLSWALKMLLFFLPSTM